MTANRVYSLTKQTEYVLNNLEDDIYIYTLYSNNYEDPDVMELLNKYKSKSKKIHVENIDIEATPGKIAYYQNVKQARISLNGIIVTNAADTADTKQSFKILDSNDMFSYDSQTQSNTLFTGEDAVTGAIRYVLNPNVPKVWFLGGHGTTSQDWAEMNATLEDENYDTGVLSLITEPEN